MDVFLKGDEVATLNLTPGISVYGEELITEDVEYRLWNPRRSKLSAAILNGLKNLDIKNDDKVLYLGASTGTTVSHISDIAYNGRIYAVEFSPVNVDFLYCDVAQPTQSELFMKNMNLFSKDNTLGMITIKARSIDVVQKPKKIFKQEEKKFKEKGFKIIEKVKLEPYEKDHIAFLVEKNF